VLDERALHHAVNLLYMAPVQGGEDRMLVRKVLIDGTDAHPCNLGNSIRRDGADTFALQDPDHSIEYCVDCLPGPALLRAAPG
jgi:hypothetical protein